MYVDCEYVTQTTVQPRGQIDVNGDMVLGKTPGNNAVAVSN